MTQLNTVINIDRHLTGLRARRLMKLKNAFADIICGINLHISSDQLSDCI